MSHKLEGPVWLMQPIPYFGEDLSYGWKWEPKIDGWRMQIIRYANGRVELWGRRLERKPNWTEKLPSICERVKKLFPKGIIIDAELSTSRGRRFIPSLFSKRPKAEAIVYIFDLIFYNNKFIGDIPLEERKKILKSFSYEEPFRLVLGKKIRNLGKALEEALLKGMEGIIVKKIDSPYTLCKEGPIATENWRKIKP